MPTKIYLLPLTKDEALLIDIALSATMAAYDTPAFQNTFTPEVIQEKKSKTYALIKQLKNLK